MASSIEEVSKKTAENVEKSTLSLIILVYAYILYESNT
jgi:hypothetical protein